MTANISLPNSFEDFLAGVNDNEDVPCLRSLYSLVRGLNRNCEKECLLDELLMEGMETEQVWQQIDLLNRNRVGGVKKCTSGDVETRQQLEKLVDKVKNLVHHNNDEEDGEDEFSENDASEGGSAEEGEGEGEESMDNESGEEESVDGDVNNDIGDDKLEDGFLNLDQMHQFLDDQDALAEKDDVQDLAAEGIDLFLDEDTPLHKSASNSRYADFFDSPDGLQDPSTSAKDNPTTFQLTQNKLKEKIENFEVENVNEKSWLMKGEASGEARPENSVLEEYLDFDHATRLPPVITEEVTLKLEDIVKQRIKDKAFDDVIRKNKPVRDAAKYRNQLVLEQEKSKVSLSQVYEQEFLKQSQKEETMKKNPLHETIRDAMTQLFRKLDSLSNYHYTPQMPVSEVKIVNNMPSLQVEEVGPETATKSSMLAPEEIKTASVADPKAVTERSATDKKRSLRKKKMKSKRRSDLQKERDSGNAVDEDKLQELRKVGRVKKAKLDPKAGKKVGVSSASFFSRLQDEAQSDIMKKKSNNQTAAKRKNTKSGAEYKL